MAKHLPAPGSGQAGLSLRCDRCVSPQRASQILAHALGHGYSRQSVLLLIEEGRVRAHQIRKHGRWYVETDSIMDLIQQVLTQAPS